MIRRSALILLVFYFMELWKKIDGFENYGISNYGNVKNLKTKRLLKKSFNSDFYIRVCLRNDFKQKNFTIHRLVAKAFIKNLNNKETVNHINGIKTDNNINNLEWATRKEQMIHAVKNKLHKTINNKIVLNTETGIYYNSIKEASLSINYKPCTLSLKLNGKRNNNTNLIYV